MRTNNGTEERKSVIKEKKREERKDGLELFSRASKRTERNTWTCARGRVSIPHLTRCAEW